MKEPEKNRKVQYMVKGTEHVLRWTFLVIIVLFLLFLTIVFARGQYASSKKISDINEGWYNQDGEVITLPAKVHAPAGQPSSIWRRLSGEFNTRYTICFRSSQQEVDVRLDGTSIYRYQAPSGQLFSRGAASRWNFVSIPEGSGGALLEIEMISPYKAYTGAYGQIQYGTSYDIYNMVYERSKPALLFSVLMLGLGFFLFVVYFLTKDLMKIPSIFWLGMFLALFGTWSWLEAKPISWPSGFERYVTTLQCWAFMLVPVPFIFYIKRESDDESQYGLTVLALLSLINIVVCNVLQIAGVRDLMELIGATRILLIVMVVYGCVRGILLFQKEERPNRRILAVSAAILYGCAFLELLLYYNMSYNSMGTIIRFGVLVFAGGVSLETVRGLVKHMREKAEMQEQLQKSKIQLMIRQMQPHFLFNSLHAIQSLCYTEPREAANAIVLFSNYLRANMNCLDNDSLISSEKELEYIENYIAIQKMCFGDELIFVKKWTAKRFQIPPLTIQPFVENAIRHGIRKRKGAGKVILTARDSNAETVVTIEDDGVGYDVKAPLSENGFHSTGNVRFRLEILVGASVEVESERGTGTRVTIRIPREP